MEGRIQVIRQDNLNSLDFNAVDKVGDVTWHLIWQEYRIWTIIVIVAVIFIILIIFAIGFDLFRILIFAVAFLFIYFGYIQTKAKRWFMQQFAVANNLEYLHSLSTSDVKGRLFKVGHSRSITDVVSANYQDHLLRLFHYQYTVGHGKHSRTYNFTVTEIFFEQVQFPNILLQSKTMATYGSKGKNIKTIKLEEEFEKFYRLHATEGYEIEIFQIFTPKVLRFLKEKGLHFSIEFAEDRLYVYDNVNILNKKQLLEMYQVTRQIFDSIGSLLNRLQNDFAVLHPYYKK